MEGAALNGRLYAPPVLTGKVFIAKYPATPTATPALSKNAAGAPNQNQINPVRLLASKAHTL